MVYYRFINDKTDKRKIQHESGFSLLQDIMRERFGYDIIESDIIMDENGKPYLRGFDNIFFNISHCDGLCCAIVTIGNRCGIDCEKIRPFRENVCRRVFTDEERKMFDSLSAGEKNFFFFVLWTLKEAFGKFTGKGIADMKNISFSFGSGQLVSSCPELDFRVFQKEDYILSTCYEKSAADLQNTECSFGKRIY